MTSPFDASSPKYVAHYHSYAPSPDDTLVINAPRILLTEQEARAYITRRYANYVSKYFCSDGYILDEWVHCAQDIETRVKYGKTAKLATEMFHFSATIQCTSDWRVEFIDVNDLFPKAVEAINKARQAYLEEHKDDWKYE